MPASARSTIRRVGSSARPWPTSRQRRRRPPGEPINYEGAYHAIDWDARGDMFPPLVHWKIENGQFVEYELYACSRDQPNCPGL